MGIVLTGGTSKMEGVVELAEEIFHMPVRVGFPQAIQGLNDIVRNPIYATGVGLLLYAAEHQEEGGTTANRAKESGESLIEKVKGWFESNF